MALSLSLFKGTWLSGKKRFKIQKKWVNTAPHLVEGGILEF